MKNKNNEWTNEFEKYSRKHPSKDRVCPTCGRCPTCGHRRQRDDTYLPIRWEWTPYLYNKPGVYTDKRGVWVAID